jgi:hypothetical protein
MLAGLYQHARKLYVPISYDFNTVLPFNTHLEKTTKYSYAIPLGLGQCKSINLFRASILSVRSPSSYTNSSTNCESISTVTETDP